MKITGSILWFWFTLLFLIYFDSCGAALLIILARSNSFCLRAFHPACDSSQKAKHVWVQWASKRRNEMACGDNFVPFRTTALKPRGRLVLVWGRFHPLVRFQEFSVSSCKKRGAQGDRFTRMRASTFYWLTKQAQSMTTTANFGEPINQVKIL